MVRKTRRKPAFESCPMAVPENFDADSLLVGVGRADMAANLKDAMYYILDTLVQMGNRQDTRHQLEKVGYYYLSSDILGKICGKRYSTALKILSKAGIIASNNSYSAGKFSKGYRLTGKYSSADIKFRELSDQGSIKKKIIEYRNQQELLNNAELDKIPYITKWYNPDKLKIDVEQAHVFMEFYKKVLIDLIPASTSDDKRKELTNRINQRYNSSINSANKIRSGEFNLKRTSTDHRLHSSVTSMKKELRGFLKYDNKSLVGIDIKACQPFLLTQLLKKQTFSKTTEGLDIQTQYPKLYTALQGQGLQNLQSIFMSVGYSQNDGSHLPAANFEEINWEKDFYSKLIELELELFGKTGRSFTSRGAAKKQMMVILYSKNKNKKYYQSVERFKKMFPREGQLIEIFSDLGRKHNENFLPILMQRFESKLILDIVCKEVSDLLPEAPIIPVHDSILTTPEYVDQVKEIMSNTIMRVTGLRPGLTLDNDTPEVILKNLSEVSKEDFEEIINNPSSGLEEHDILSKKHLLDIIPYWNGKKILSTKYLQDEE